MKLSSFQTLSLAALALTALGQSPGRAATLSDGKRAMPIQIQTQTPSQPRVALPSRTEVLAVDWVDTKNAKIAIGGITYALTGTLPHIVLAGGEQVTNIGYLKSGMQVRIRTAPDGAGNARLVEITVIG